jgi:mediator of RNA polymerase II transcription subunit 24
VTAALQRLEPSSTPTSSIPKVIIRAEPTLAGILKTLNADYPKIQEALLSMLYQVLTGKSFELMLAVATVEGKLKTFVTKLIKFNECSKQINEPVPGKTAATRAMLFDVSFLMLCSIVQTYGSDVSLDTDLNFISAKNHMNQLKYAY